MKNGQWGAAWLMVLAAPATGQDMPVQGAHLQAIDVFDLAARATAAGRIDEALKLYDALTRDRDLEIRSEARFRKGELLAAHGRWREAALAYRRLLDEKPDAAGVRLALAAALARLGDEPGARRQLRLAAATGLPPAVQEQVVAYSRALRSPQRYGGTVEAMLAPDTNINRGTEARTLDTIIAPLLLDRAARATSGIGLRLRPSAFAKQPLGDRVALVARASGSADLYRGGDGNDLLGTVLIGGEWRGGRDRVSLAGGWSRRWYGSARFADTRSLSGEWLHQLALTTQLSTTFSHGIIRYRRNPLQNGTLTDVSATVEHAISARAGAALGLAGTRQDAADASYASWSGGPLGFAWLDKGHTTLFAAASARRLLGDARNFLFLDKRREWFASGKIGATFRRWSVHGFSPTARLGYERNWSTVSVYAYRRTYAELGVSRSF